MKKYIHFLEQGFVLILSGLFLALGLFFEEKTMGFLSFSPFWITLFLSGLPIFYQAVEALLQEKGMAKLSSNLLIILGTMASVGLGDLLAASEIVFIMALGTWLEEKTIARAKKGLYQLIKSTPEFARKWVNGQAEQISVEDVKPGDILRVLPGERIAVDGRVLSGESAIDQAVLTGESLPVDKQKGDEVFGGTQNLYGTLDFVATKAGKDSALQRLIRLVEEAEREQAPIQKTADKFANFMVPLSLFIAGLTYIVTGEISRAVSVMVVFCPCALVLATPTAIMAAIGQATKRGVIIKSGQILERLDQVDTLAFDKTGTLTQAKLHLAQIYTCCSTLDEQELLRYVASAEQKSEHPLAKTLVQTAKEKGLKLLDTRSFKMFAGRGIVADFEDKEDIKIKRIFAGNQKFLTEQGFELNSLLTQIKGEGYALIFVGEEKFEQGVYTKNMLACFALSDTLKVESKEVLQTLKEMGLKLCLMTGDNIQTAHYFAKIFGLKEVYADLLPEQKAHRIAEKQLNQHCIAMIGDGVNDALALKKANIGMAMGALGSDLAIESADIVLLKDDLTQLPYLKRLSKACKQTITLSLSMAMLINVMALILSVLGYLNPTGGALVHNLGSVCVILFAALLYDRKF